MPRFDVSLKYSRNVKDLFTERGTRGVSLKGAPNTTRSGEGGGKPALIF